MSTQYPQYGMSSPQPVVRLPGFAKGMIIADLVFCIIRIPITMQVVLGLLVMINQGDQEGLWLALIELSTNLGMFAVGIGANILLLMKKPIGVSLAYGYLGITVPNIFVQVMYLIQTVPEFEDAIPELANNQALMMGVIVVGVVVVCIRVALAIAYLIAVNSAKSAFRSADQQTVPPEFHPPPKF